MQSNTSASSSQSSTGSYGVGTTLNFSPQTLNLLQQQQAQFNASNLLQQTQQKDTTFTKIFVGGLPYHTTDESLKVFFQRFGNIEEAVVINDRSTGKSRGYGFVTMETKEAADSAVLDPNPIIDGRKANVNLAYLGVKSRIVQPTSYIPLTLARYPIQTAAPTYGFHPLYYHQLTNSSPQQTYQLTTPTNLLLSNQAGSVGGPNGSFSQLGSTSNTGLFDLSAYNSHIAAANALNSNRTSPFESTQNQFIPFNAAALANPNSTNQNALNSVLSAASGSQSNGNYFTIAPQHLTTGFQQQ